MARQESDREDTMREATALVERAELREQGRDESVIIGFRRNGEASLFFGQDPVFHFNAANELRRAYVGGDLIKAECGTLVRLRRVRTADEVQLERRPLTAHEQQAQLDQLQSLLGTLRASLAANQCSLVSQHPPQADVLERIRLWVEQLSETVAVAEQPNVR